MAIANAINAASRTAANKPAVSAGNTSGAKYKAGKTPTHTLSVGKGADRESRTYTTLAFLFPTAFGGDASALGGAELMPRESEDSPIQKNGLVKYFATKDREGNAILKKRIKKSVDDERGVFETVCMLKEVNKNGKVILVGEVDAETVMFVQSWSPKAK